MPCNKDNFTEADIPDLRGYVVIVTGGNFLSSLIDTDTQGSN
jgi:hypothetical protein